MRGRTAAIIVGVIAMIAVLLGATSLPRAKSEVSASPLHAAVTIQPAPPTTATGIHDTSAEVDPAALVGQIQAVVQYVQAVQLQEYLDSLPKFYVDVGHWTAINRCEEGGTWNNDGWTSDGHFQGGLGMSVQAWNEVVAEAPQYGFSLPPSSNMATPYQQMQGAQILLNRVGPGGWACKG